MPVPIVLLTELFPPAVGGSAVLLANVYGRLDGIAVTVVTPRPIDDPLFQAVPAEINGSYRGLRPMGAARQHVRLARQLRHHLARHPGILHCARPLPEAAAALATHVLPGRRLDYVTWTHGEDLSAALTSREHAWLARRVCGGATAVIASSRFSASLAERLGTPSDRLRIAHPGVDADRFALDGPVDRRAAGLADDELVLLTVGRLQRRKGHDMVIQAVALLKDELPKLRYLIAGGGTERARLEALVRDRGVGDRVRFLGEVPDAELPRLYALCDVFAMPNRTDGHDVEGFGIVFLEAAAAGRPTIGGRSGGVPEAIADGETGLLTDGGSPEAVAAAIRTLGLSADLRARMGAAGRTRVRADFTWAHAAARVRALHEAMTAS